MTSAGQVYGIDFLRFFAAALVMVYHIGFICWASPHNFFHTDILIFAPLHGLAPAIDTGWVGVQIFFVISGFVIAYTSNGASPLQFFNRRIVRLGPALWICASLTIPMLLLAGEGSVSVLGKYAASLLFMPFVPKMASSYWTLPIEIVFYGLIFLLLCYNRFRNIEAATLALGAVSSTVWVVYWLRFMLPLGAVGRMAAMLGDQGWTQIVLAQHGVFFAVGLTLWLVSRYGWTQRRLISLSVFVMAGVLEIIAETGKSSAWTGVAENSYVPVGIWLAAVAAIPVSIAFNERLSRLLGPGRRLARFIGLTTYPLYLIHEPIGGFVLIRLIYAGCPPMLALMSASLVCVVVAAVIAVRLEPVVQGWTRQALVAVDRRLPSGFDRYRRATAIVSTAAE
jgi:peptidoglycan/LPS O-acetylase OafA/YrhL